MTTSESAWRLAWLSHLSQLDIQFDFKFQIDVCLANKHQVSIAKMSVVLSAYSHQVFSSQSRTKEDVYFVVLFCCIIASIKCLLTSRLSLRSYTNLLWLVVSIQAFSLINCLSIYKVVSNLACEDVCSVVFLRSDSTTYQTKSTRKSNSIWHRNNVKSDFQSISLEKRRNRIRLHVFD